MPYKLDQREYFLLYMNLKYGLKFPSGKKKVVFAKTLVLNLKYSYKLEFNLFIYKHCMKVVPLDLLSCQEKTSITLMYNILACVVTKTSS
jgi:hypothetical protein